MEYFFKRYEEKYLVNREQSAALRDLLTRRMVPDRYGEYWVQNLYFDTENWDIIRASLEKPAYKEKMRLRGYGAARPESELYLELKKKYKGLVYKRRCAVPARSYAAGAARDMVAGGESQIRREMDFYFRAHAVRERVFISYKRTAYAGTDDAGLRVTFDTDARFRLNNLDFNNPRDGRAFLARDTAVMEIKTPAGIPMWLARALGELRVYPAPFSKYGVCYTEHIRAARVPSVYGKERDEPCLISSTPA